MSQTTGPRGARTPGSFSPVVAGTNAPSQSQPAFNTPRPPLRRVDSSSSEDSAPLTLAKPRAQQQNVNALSNSPIIQPPRPPYATSHSNSSTGSLQNFSRPTPPIQSRSDLPLRNASPIVGPPKPSGSSVDFVRGHGRKHSHTQGSFEPYLPTTATSNLNNMANLNSGLSASQIAAQAAMQHQAHNRQRSQTVPSQQHHDSSSSGSSSRKPSRAGPTSPPVLSLTEASGPREGNFVGQVYHNGLLAGGSQSAAQTAANVVFPKSPVSSPGLPPLDYDQHRIQSDKPFKTEKSKTKLFSRPGKIGISKDKEARSGALPSPSKMASYTLQSLQRGNFSTNSLTDSMSSAAGMYSMANSSSSTIRAVDTPSERESREKEKHKHHFLSRQKHKLSSKDEHHLPLSSAASNSRPADPSAPSSLYNFNLPPSPAPTTTSFAKSMSGLDLRHGGRALREKKKEEKSDALRESELSYQNSNEWPGPSSLGSGAGSYLGSTTSYPASMYGGEAPQDLGKYGLNNMGADDAWPFLKAKLLIIFEGEDLRLPVEDFNRLVTIHLQRCIQKRAPSLIVEDLRDLLATGFSSLDQTLRQTPDERSIPRLVEMWLFTFTSILPYMQAVFLPLDLEFSGHGPLMSADTAREFWGALPSSSNGNIPAGQALEVRRIVLTAYRDTVILPRFETLKTIFSRLSLESISLALPPTDILSTSPDSFGRPSTAMSLDPSHGSYGSQATTLLGGGSSGDGSGNRSRAISNVSYGSDSASGLGINNMPPPPQRPFTPSSTYPLQRQRERTVEDSSKQITETVGRMLQCMSVLASVGVGGGGDEGSQKKMEELTRGLKLNWLGRGRMGRDRRGLVGARVTGTLAGGRSGVMA
ncbi:HbrB-like-domain-containing protein [Amylocarpus encephaloides]|uniref:HbrB-like-domain-containing protein n=1 Tax=Amylocarpus encephaloides TaxID=45428 RepID=A0A9P8C4R2_9HELO|nr:HbrB-like-domain-containing protein [Amylocarpus encephaloides]